jgi:hypothetical protein
MIRMAVERYLDDNGCPWWHPDHYATSNIRIFHFVESEYLAALRERWPEQPKTLRTPPCTFTIGTDDPPERGIPCVYRHWDADGQLLYVGFTMDFVGRQRTHQYVAPWRYEVALVTLEEYLLRDEALVAEARAIRDEQPVHNRQRPALAE